MLIREGSAMYQRSYVNHCVTAFALVLLLCACEEAVGLIGAKSADARWEKVCTKEYFYNFLHRTGQGGKTYCSEWKKECVSKDGAPATGCV
jgi:hypothetical protein